MPFCKGQVGVDDDTIRVTRWIARAKTAEPLFSPPSIATQRSLSVVVIAFHIVWSAKDLGTRSAAIGATMRLSVVLVATLFALEGCAATPARTGAPLAVAQGPSFSAKAKRSSEIVPTTSLVWTKSSDGSLATVRLDDDGSVLDRTAGVRIVASHSEWAWSTRREGIATADCTSPAIPAREGWSTTASVVSGRNEQVVARRKADIESLNEVSHAVDLLFSMGPLLFIEERESLFACGAHGTETRSFFVWDIEKREKVQVLEQLPQPRLRAAARPLLIDAGGFAEGEPEITEIIPFIREGRVRFEAQVTGSACYACGDGRWSSYTRSVRVPVDTPPALALHAHVPRGVAAFAQAHPDLAVGGFSHLP